MVHTDHIGVAVKDALEAIYDNNAIKCGDDELFMEFVDAEEPSNLRLVLEDGQVFRIRIIRQG